MMRGAQTKKLVHITRFKKTFLNVELPSDSLIFNEIIFKEKEEVSIF